MCWFLRLDAGKARLSVGSTKRNALQTCTQPKPCHQESHLLERWLHHKGHNQKLYSLQLLRADVRKISRLELPILLAFKWALLSGLTACLTHSLIRPCCTWHTCAL